MSIRHAEIRSSSRCDIHRALLLTTCFFNTQMRLCSELHCGYYTLLGISVLEQRLYFTLTLTTNYIIICHVIIYFMWLLNVSCFIILAVHEFTRIEIH